MTLGMREDICRKITAAVRKLMTQTYQYNLRNEGKYHIGVNFELGCNFGSGLEVRLWDTSHYNGEAGSLEMKYLANYSDHKLFYFATQSECVDKINRLTESLENKTFNAEEVFQNDL